MVLVKIKRWIMALVILYSFGYTEAFAYGFDRNAQSASWGYQSVYGSTTTGNSYGTTPYGSAAKSPSTTMGYQFRSTSAYRSTLAEERNYSRLDIAGARRSGSSVWDEEYDFPGIGDDDNPVGTLSEQPVGDTPWVIMLLLAAGYIAFRQRRLRKAPSTKNT
jgi:hypothetical protein